jgi:hypothetical protein
MNKFKIFIAVTLTAFLMSFMSSQPQEERSVPFIDEDGRAGTIKGQFEDNAVKKLWFVSETETGNYEEYYSFQEGLSSVVVKETTFNRPKFWNESLARANDDTEWFDPSKSRTTSITHFFSNGKYEFSENENGERSYPVNKRLRKAGEIFLKKADDYLHALSK